MFIDDDSTYMNTYEFKMRFRGNAYTLYDHKWLVSLRYFTNEVDEKFEQKKASCRVHEIAEINFCYRCDNNYKEQFMNWVTFKLIAIKMSFTLFNNKPSEFGLLTLHV